MPKVRRSSYNLAFKLKVVAEAEAVENNSEIATDYGISESMVRRWRKDWFCGNSTGRRGVRCDGRRGEKFTEPIVRFACVNCIIDNQTVSDHKI